MRPVRVGPLLRPVRLIGEQVKLSTEDGRLLVIMTAGGQVVAEHSGHLRGTGHRISNLEGS